MSVPVSAGLSSITNQPRLKFFGTFWVTSGFSPRMTTVPVFTLRSWAPAAQRAGSFSEYRSRWVSSGPSHSRCAESNR